MATSVIKHNNYSLDPNCLNSLYKFRDEIGCGGFGKVKLATHILTGEDVAIKIIDKTAVKEDLPRVYMELDALRCLAHQNICRMYQYVETPDKVYIVMEYCDGGELFDYIVKKERLDESDARLVFRQLVQSVAYIHSEGFAHRDLKPENFLLNSSLRLKLIDFGLCARPRLGLGVSLNTLCGSPAYAAPELVSGMKYLGHRADIWSMGVILYALLCGTLPFEDSNVTRLYQKIMHGSFFIPSFLSNTSKNLLQLMLTVNPERRITMHKILVHPWLNDGYDQPPRYTSIYNKNVIDEEVAKEMAFYYSIKPAKMISLLKQWRFDYITGTYLILLRKKEAGKIFNLPLMRPKYPNVCSPTIHGSLDEHMNLQGTSDAQMPGTYVDLQRTYVNLQGPNPNIYGTPISHFATVPRRAKNQTKEDASTTVTTVSIDNDRGRSPNTGTKTPRLRKRLFKSLERSADKMINLLTPRRRMREDSGPATVKSVNIMTLSVTSSKDPYEVRKELVRVLIDLGITPVEKGWKISGSKKTQHGSMTVEYEVVMLDNMEYVGVQRRRLNGDAFLYKKVCEKVLELGGMQASKEAV